MMDEGSRGDMFERMKFIELQIDMVQIIIENPKLFTEKSFKEKLKKHLKYTEQVFIEINNLSQFNELEIPKKIDFLTCVNKIQQIIVYNEKYTEEETLNKIKEVYDILKPLNIEEYPEIESQLVKISKILYDTIGKISWNSSSLLSQTSVLQNISFLFEDQIILKNIFDFNLEDKKSENFTRILLEIMDISPFIKTQLISYFSSFTSLHLSKFVPTQLTDSDLEKKFFVLKGITSIQKLYLKGSAMLTSKSLQIFVDWLPTLKEISLDNFWNLTEIVKKKNYFLLFFILIFFFFFFF